jgi:phosphonate transport system permease protein
MTFADPVALFERQRAELARQRLIQTAIFGAAFLLTLLWAAITSGFVPQTVLAGLPRIGEYFGRIVPNLEPQSLFANAETEGSLAYWFFKIDVWSRLLLETAQMALMATVIGASIALLFSFPAARNLAPNLWLSRIIRRFLELLRTIPDIVYALILVWALGVGPLAGILAMALHTIGALGKLFAEVNENASGKPIEGVRGVGGNWFAEMRYGVLPQVLPNFMSYAMLRFEVNVRAASVIGFVGAGGIGQELQTVIGLNYYTDVSALLLLIILTVVLIDSLSALIRKRLIEGGSAHP